MKMLKILVVLACAHSHFGAEGVSHGLKTSHPFVSEFRPPLAVAKGDTKSHTTSAKQLPAYLMNRIDDSTNSQSPNHPETSEKYQPPSRHKNNHDVSIPGVGENIYHEGDHHQGCNTVSTRLQANIAPLALPGPSTCRSTRESSEGGRENLPPNVCDLCPRTEGNRNPLDPCMCIGNNDTSAGMISITCPPTMATLEQLESLLAAPDYITTDVFRFTLKGSKVSGVLTQEIWGNLTFHQVVIEENHITHVDYHTFSRSAQTLTSISLFNNEISYFVTNGQDDLPMLRSLVLKRNNISVIFNSAFGYSSLRYLDLSYNQISTIGNEAFAGLDKLEQLVLSHNQLTSIEDESFLFHNHRPDSNFLDIDLSYNAITFIEDNAFPGLANARIILEGNQLQTISEKVFKPIVVDSSYFAVFIFEGNPVICDCDILWIIENPFIISCFDDFMCSNIHKTLHVLTPEDLNCTRV